MEIIQKIKIWMLRFPQESRLIYILMICIIIFSVYNTFLQYFFAIIIFFLGGVLGKWLGSTNPFKNKEDEYLDLEEAKNGYNNNTKRK